MSEQSSSLLRYAARRALVAIPLIFGVIILNFVIIHAAPGDPIIMLAGEYEPSPHYLSVMRQKYNLDLPLPQQLALYVWSVLQGDLGTSISYGQPVLDIIAGRAPATILLMGVAISFSILIGIFLGVLSAWRAHTIVDNVTTVFSLVAWSLPIFWLAQLLMIVFSLNLHLFPTGGMTSLGKQLSGIDSVLDLLWHLFLPALTIALLRLAATTRLTRASMLEVLSQDYIVAAYSKGLRQRTILLKHALKNALRPVVTMTGLAVGTMIAGAVLTETVYSWPGIGRLFADAIFARDYPLLLGLFIVISITVIAANFVTDIVYSVIDPRVRHRSS